MARAVVGVVSAAVVTVVVVATGLQSGTDWLVAEAVGDPAYEFSGEYAEQQRGLGDFGQRWYDPRYQSFYAADPAPVDDSAGLLTMPGLTSSYALGLHNSYLHADPDGRMPRRRLLTVTNEPVQYYSDSDATMSEDSVGSDSDEHDGGEGVPALVPLGGAPGSAVGVPDGDVAMPDAPGMDSFPDRTAEIREHYRTATMTEVVKPTFDAQSAPWWWLSGDGEWRRQLAARQGSEHFVAMSLASHGAMQHAMNRMRRPESTSEAILLGQRAVHQFLETYPQPPADGLQ